MPKVHESNGFIPAREHRGFIFLWKWYVQLLFRRRFSRIFLRQEIPVPKDVPVLFYCNHFYWWDALIPFYVSHFVFGHQPRAVMEDKQMRKYPFFSRIGAFSVNRDEKRHVLTTLRYASDWLTTGGRSLFLFPNGKFTSPLKEIPVFEPGLHWIAEHAPKACVIPFAYYIDYQSGDKPDLYLATGDILEPATADNRSSWLAHARVKLSEELQRTQQRDVQGWKQIR